MNTSLRILLVAVAIVLLLPALAAACPLCKDAKSDADYAGGTASLPSGFYYSVILMVSAPFVVVGGLLFRIYLSRRRLRASRDQTASDAPLLPDSTGAHS